VLLLFIIIWVYNPNPRLATKSKINLSNYLIARNLAGRALCGKLKERKPLRRDSKPDTYYFEGALREARLAFNVSSALSHLSLKLRPTSAAV